MGTSFSNSDFSAATATSSGAFKKLGNAVTGRLSSSQKQVLYKTMAKYKNSSNPLGKALGELDLGRNDGIDSSAVSRIKAATGASIDRSGYYASAKKNISQKPKVDMNKVMQEIMAKKRTPNGNPAGQFPSASGRLSPSAPPSTPRLGQPGAAMTGSQFNQQFFKRGGSNLGLAGVAGTRH